MKKIVSNKTKKLKSYYFGIIAEYIAIIYLILRGYKILKRRYRSKIGEIDLIAKKSDYLVIIEVKARKKIRTIEEVLTNNQQRRIVNSALNLISKNKKYQDLSVRFDLIIVKPFKVSHHLKGCFD